jgi:hypothetical protein
MEIWQEGDIVALEKYLATSAWGQPEMQGMHRKIITERNKNMVQKIELLIKEPGVDFIVAGAAHFVGKDGIVELLRRKGYPIERL